MRFRGSFTVDVGNTKQFKIINHGALIENELYWKGLFNTWEADTGWLWKKLAKDAAVILDIGANTGVYSLVAKTLNPSARVIAFEPSRNIFNKLKDNVRLNEYDIDCHQVALSNLDGHQTFYDVNEENPTSASLSPEQLKNAEDYTGEIVEYDVITQQLDTFIKQNELENIDLIKLDVEQHEPEVIEGFSNYIQKFMPIIFMEVLNARMGRRLDDMDELKGFKIYHLKGDKKVERFQKFSDFTRWENEERNFVLLPPNKQIEGVNT
jgi:FkbM family methyltransferase